jgi:hypothetical protein
MYSLRVSTPPPQLKILGAQLNVENILNDCLSDVSKL